MDISKLPKWAQQLIADQQRVISDQKTAIDRLTEVTGITITDAVDASPDHIVVGGYAWPTSTRYVAMPIGRRDKGSSFEFVRLTLRETVDGRKAIGVMYGGYGDLEVRPQASNAINITVGYEKGGRVMGG